MKSLEINSNAKINLSLNITGVRETLHTLDMVIVSVDLADIVVIKKREDKKVKVSYLINDNKAVSCFDNCSVTNAINVFKNKIGFGGVEIDVIKRIPIAAGLGGSGVDAAGVLRGLAQMNGIAVNNKELIEIAMAIGSDVPYLLRGGLARVRGVGNEIEYFDKGSHKTGFNIVIAKGKGGVLSKDAYRVFDEIYIDKKFEPSDNDGLLENLKSGVNSFRAFDFMDNALTKASIKINYEVANTLLELHNVGAIKTIMTGSGSGCVGFFCSYKKALQAAKELKDKGFFAYVSKTIA
ncbi:MAG: hypothetical protein FWE13_00745 [Firmicutes bacterium]|nr:hypothetical protein [Bacillota bacterium]